MLTIDKFYDARKILSPVLRHTPLIHAPRFSLDTEVYIKPENLQITGSFKVRGAYYKIAKLSEEDKKRGVVACSAGNHAQGVALGSQANNIKAKIFVPSTAPISKVEATKRYGAEVVLVDGIYDDDPKTNPNAKKLDKISYGEYMAKGLKAMDMTAITICQENDIHVLSFGLFEENALMRAVTGETIGTLIS